MRFSALFTLFLVFPLAIPAAVELPPPAFQPFFMQTNGTNSAIGRGDWYSSPNNGVGAGSHFIIIFVPDGWPASSPIHIDIESPGFNFNGTGNDPIDEDKAPAANATDTNWELFLDREDTSADDINLDPADPTTPAAGTGFPSTSFAPIQSGEGTVQFRRAFTISSPVPNSRYIMRTDSGSYDGDNSWRVRVGSDDDSDPTNGMPANADNPDGLEGTDDELAIGFNAATFQHSSNNVECLQLSAFVPVGNPSVTFDNFDMDGDTRIRYYSPSQTVDPNGQSGGTAGTVSGQTTWNNGGTQTTRVGDTINNPEFGLWTTVSCLTDNNQFAFETDATVVIFTEKRQPNMDFTKTASVTQAGPDASFFYTLDFTNNVPTQPQLEPGAARNVQIVDTLPDEVEFRGATIQPPFTGTVTHNSGTVTIDINEIVATGDSGSVQIDVEAKKSLSGNSLMNSADITYADSYENVFPPITDTAIVNVDPLLADVVAFDVLHQGPGSLPVVRWQTASEFETVGFDLFRLAPGASFPGQKVNESLIFAKGGPFEAADYEVPGVKPMQPDARPLYYLRETELSGNQLWHGPASVKGTNATATRVEDWLELH